MAGTLCVERARGGNLPLLTVFDGMGYDLNIRPEFNFVETDRALNNCYKIDLEFNELYIDYDDTIIVHDKVNLSAIALIYKCLNQNIPVYLVTKHENDIHQSLQARHISEGIFANIIHIQKGDKKIDYMHPGAKALYIDDSFAEREAVRRQFGIEVTGVDSLEVLLNGGMM